METGYVLMTTIDGVDMFYGICEVEGATVEPGLIGAVMVSDKSDLSYLVKYNHGAYQPSTGVYHNTLNWVIREVEVEIKP